MSSNYGQAVIFGATSAPALFTGVTKDYSYDDQLTRQLFQAATGAYRAAVQHSSKAALRFTAEVTSGSSDFLDLSSSAAAITVSGISSGVILVSRAVERWRLAQAKECSIEATHYKDMVLGGGSAAATTLSAYTPDQSGLTILTPGDQLIWGTYPMAQGTNVIHGMELTQELQIIEDPVSPAGTILSAHAVGYMKTLTLDLLAITTPPAKGATLSITNGPDHAADFKVESAEKMFKFLGAMMYRVTAFWIPPFSA